MAEVSETCASVWVSPACCLCLSRPGRSASSASAIPDTADAAAAPRAAPQAQRAASSLPATQTEPASLVAPRAVRPRPGPGAAVGRRPAVRLRAD